MSKQSVVDFPASARTHVGLAVSSLKASLPFYESLLDAAPTKRRHGYARFELAQPALNLSLIENERASPMVAPSHFGIQVKSSAAVRLAEQRLRAAGFSVRVEADQLCCHAVQDKVWTADPDGNAWEVYVVLDDDPQAMPSAIGASCCDPVAGVPASAGCATEHLGKTIATSRPLAPATG